MIVLKNSSSYYSELRFILIFKNAIKDLKLDFIGEVYFADSTYIASSVFACSVLMSFFFGVDASVLFLLP